METIRLAGLETYISWQAWPDAFGLTLFLPETVLSTDGAISSQGWAQKQVGLTRNAQCENSAPIRKMPKKSDFKHVVVQRPIFAEDKL